MRPSSVVRFVLAQCACAIALVGLVPPAAAHGGAYSPVSSATQPVSTLPTGPTPPTMTGPATGGPSAGAAVATEAVSNVATWEDWWHFNRDGYLQLKRAIAAGAPTTLADEIVSGRVRASQPTVDVVRSKVLPVLRGLVETERATELVGGAMVALARAGEDAGEAGSLTIPVLVKRLADPNQEIAETAALSLGILESEESFPILEALLENGEKGRALVGGHDVGDRTRAFAAYGLGLVAHRAENNRARQLAARALCAALEARRAATPDVEVAALIGLSLGPLEPERAPSATAPWISRQTEIAFVSGILDDPRRRPVVRAHAVTALARLAQGAPEELRAEVAEQILALVRGRSRLENEVLQSCAQALGLLGDADSDLLDRKIRNSLGTLLDDADVQARSFALIALAEVGSRAGAPGDDEDEGSTGCRNLITGELVHGRGLTRPWAAIALGVLERRILDQVGDVDAEDPAAAASTNSPLLPSKATRDALRKYFQGARQRTHIGAGALALGLCRDRRSVPLLIERLDELTEDQGQGYVALALGMIGSPEAVPPLQELARTAKYKPALLEQVATALALLGSKPTPVELAELLANAQGQFAQTSYANALGRIGDDRAVDPLIATIGKKGLTSSARGFAAAALGQVADRSLLPWFAPIAADLNYLARTSTLIAGDGMGLLEIL